jgi:predicted ATP-grasp superfamily ATP-dependent carboligase
MFVARPLADEYFIDEKQKDLDLYTEWCLSECHNRRVNIFWPFRGAENLIGHVKEFEAIGTRLIVPATSDTLNILNDKVLFYNNLADTSLGLPLWYEVNSYEEFIYVVDLMLSDRRTVCFKPAKSIYGLGFKVIRDNQDPLSAFLSSDTVRCSFQEAKSRLKVSHDKFVKLLVMERLPGPEYSLDCLAMDGKLLKVTIRQKPLIAGRPEKLIFDEELIEIAERLAKHFNLSWIFNLQIMDSDEGHKILEINPRMAGGLYFSCLGGINYPYWALRLAMEDCAHLIPGQAYDLLVHQVYQPFIYEINN